MKTAAHPEPTAPRRLSAEDRREQIMQAAARLFTERGFEAVGMADIASALGTSRPTVYTYFASTETILEALLAEKLEHLPERLTPLLQPEQPLAFSKIFLALLQEADLLRLLGCGGGPLFRTQRRAFLKAIEERLRLQEKAEASASLHGQKRPATLLPIVLNLLSGMAYEQLTRDDLDGAELAAQLEQFIVGGIAALGQPGLGDLQRG